MSEALHSLPIFVRLAGRPVILVGAGEAADAKRRLLERAGAVVVGEDWSLDHSSFVSSEVETRAQTEPLGARPSTALGTNGRDWARAQLAIVVDDDAAVARLKARGVLVNAVDRPELCDFTLPAIVDRAPVIVAIGTGGASAGVAAGLRQRLEALLPAGLGGVARALEAGRARLRVRFPDAGERRRAIATAVGPGGALDLLAAHDAPDASAIGVGAPSARVAIRLRSADPDELTLREARLLANADRIVHAPDVPAAILDRARADAPRIVASPQGVVPDEGLTIDVSMA